MGEQIRAVRAGEEIDAGVLEGWMRAQLGAVSGPLTIEQFAAGHSNLTYLVQDADGREWVLRRPPRGANVKSGHDMLREWRMLSALYPVWPRVPQPVALCEDAQLLGAPFYLMERVHGVILRGAQPRALSDGLVENPERVERVCEALLDTLVMLHAVDLDAAHLRDVGNPVGYVQRQVEGWTGRWERARTEPVQALDDAAAWLAAHMPPEVDATLIHNDFKYDNIVFSPDLSHVVAVLDWEMSTVGDPLMDLGTTLAYWIDPDDPPALRALAFGPTMLPGSMSRAELVARYGERTGRDVSHALFYYVYGLFKVAVIGQQIYYRFHHGHTQDPRFGQLIHAVKLLGDAAAHAIARGSL
jgi:aminoglycoside phosphotransferase (APT) family kinase protein